MGSNPRSRTISVHHVDTWSEEDESTGAWVDDYLVPLLNKFGLSSKPTWMNGIMGVEAYQSKSGNTLVMVDTATRTVSTHQRLEG